MRSLVWDTFNYALDLIHNVADVFVSHAIERHGSEVGIIAEYGS